MSEGVPGKKPISEKQRLANIANAQKSTGPRTDEGKNICKFNAVRHGMRADHAVLPGESDENYQALLAAHIDEWDVHTPLQLYHVKRAVKASMKLERGDRAEEALIAQLREAAAKEDADQNAAEVEQLTRNLAADPAGTIRQLRKTVAGCIWIREQFLILQQQLKNHRSMLPSQRELSIHLLGKCMHDVYRSHPGVTRWVVAILGTIFGDEKDVDPARVLPNIPGPHPPMCREELKLRNVELLNSLPDARQSRLLLQSYIAEELSRLDEHIPFVAEVAERDHARGIEASEVALNADGKLLLGYVKTQDQSYDASLRRLQAVLTPRKPRPVRGPDRGNGTGPVKNEPAAATVEPPASEGAATPTEVPTEIGVAFASDALSGDCESLVDTPPESQPLTEVEAADEPLAELEGGFPTNRPIGSDESTIAPEAVPEPSEPDWGNDLVIELKGHPLTIRPIYEHVTPLAPEGPSQAPERTWADLTPEERQHYRETRGPRTESEQKLVDILNEKHRKICEDLDAKEREDRLRRAPEWAETWRQLLTAFKPDDPADGGAARSPPEGSMPDG